MRHATAATLALALSGCTLGGALTGGLLAHHHNADLPAEHADSDERSVPAWTAVGAAIGLGIDYLIFQAVGNAWSKPMT